MTAHIERIQQVFDREFQDRSSYRVLEAGCGSMSFLKPSDRAVITGIDISEKQLARNKILDERICGDVMTYRFADGAFDAIVCIDVLEHLDRPGLALENFSSALAPGGIMLLKLPHLWSVKGLLTKFSPHWFHVWVYRTIYGRKDAGRFDTAPFKTELKLDVSPGRLRAFAERQGLECHYEEYYESGYQAEVRRRTKVLGLLWKPAEFLVRLVSLGRISLARTEYVVVLRRPTDQP